ncbi:MAG: phosphoribosyltransferase family protein [Thermoplasmata archaeon]
MRATRGHTLALKDRADAGRQLAERLLHLQPERPVILALPRGGVPVGFEIARRLDAPLDVLLVRKVGDPRNPEYGLGAIVEDDGLLLDEDRVRATGITRVDLEPVIRREREEITRRARIYRANRPRIDWKERTVIVVDDGAATGGTLLAALRMAREQGARRIVVALGVAPADTCQRLKREVDELVVLLEPESFYAVGQFYEQFEPVEDDEVVELLRRATGR